MSKSMNVEVTYAVTGIQYGGSLEVSKFCVQKAGLVSVPDRMANTFDGTGYLRQASIYLEPEVAIPLARSLLSVAEGYVSESETAVS